MLRQVNIESQLDVFIPGIRVVLAQAHNVTEDQINVTEVGAGSVILVYVLQLRKLRLVDEALVESYPDAFWIVQGMLASDVPAVRKVAPTSTAGLKVESADGPCNGGYLSPCGETDDKVCCGDSVCACRRQVRGPGRRPPARPNKRPLPGGAQCR